MSFWQQPLVFLLITTCLQFLVLVLFFVLPLAALLTWMERRQSAYSQDRLGPTRAYFLTFKGKPVRAAGLFHVLADAVKMFFKEPFMPTAASPFIFTLAPTIGFVASLTIMAMIPFAPDLHFTSVSGIWQHIPMQMVRVDIGLLMIFALGSLSVYGVALAGWSSHNRFAFLGGLRAAAQGISYEIALGLTVMGVLMAFGTTNLQDIVAQGDLAVWQGLPAWGIFLQPFAALLFLTAAIAETKRTPFDLPESESEIVGYFVEYSSMGFGLFMLGEFIEVVVLAALFSCLFLGGWQWPWLLGDHTLWLGFTTVSLGPLTYTLLGFIIFAIKVFLMCALQLQIRWSLPRFRYDQLMHLGWKILLPAALLNFIGTAVLLWCDPTLSLLIQVGMIMSVAFAWIVAKGPKTSIAVTI